MKCLSTGKSIKLQEPPLAIGGEGSVYATDESALVAKIYHNPTAETAGKLNAMFQRIPRLPSYQNTHPPLAWPTDLIESSGKAIGFLMPRLYDMRPLYDMIVHKSRLGLAPQFNWKYLHVAALNLALCTRELHREGLVLGDFSPMNVMVNAQGLITLIDTDSFQVTDHSNKRIYPCLVRTPGYSPPEVLSQPDLAKYVRVEAADRFGLAVMLFQTLLSVHPFRGIWKGKGDPPSVDEAIYHGYYAYDGAGQLRPPKNAPPMALLHPLLQSYFSSAFGAGLSHPDIRPSASEWVASLRIAIADLQVCPNSGSHYFSRSTGKCYWCSSARSLGVELFPAA